MTSATRTTRRILLTLLFGVFVATPSFVATLTFVATLSWAEEAHADSDTNDRVEVSANHTGLVITTPDDAFKYAFGGRLQLDAAVFVEDHTRLGDGSEVRRGRIKSYGTLWSEWDYKLEVNFDPDLKVPITDGWLRYSGCEPFSVTVGHQKVPFSQSSMTSSNWQVFQERALPDAFIDNAEQGRRRMGIVLASYGDMWSYSGGVFTGGLGDRGATDEDINTGHRFVFAPIAEKTLVTTIGGSVNYRRFSGKSELQFGAQPEAHLSGSKLVDTGALESSKDIFMYNVEASLVAGPFHAQAEYTAADVSRNAGQRDLGFRGFYVQTGVFLTGESRNYDQKSGKYNRVIPTREALGAWELAARFSQIDLTNRDIRGGVQRDVTFGVNWWTNANVMFRFNYVYGNADPNSGVTLASQDEHIHAFMARTQVVF